MGDASDEQVPHVEDHGFDFIAIPCCSEEGEFEQHDEAEEDVHHSEAQERGYEQVQAHAANEGGHAAAALSAFSEQCGHGDACMHDGAAGAQPPVSCRCDASPAGSVAADQPLDQAEQQGANAAAGLQHVAQVQQAAVSGAVVHGGDDAGQAASSSGNGSRTPSVAGVSNGAAARLAANSTAAAAGTTASPVPLTAVQSAAAVVEAAAAETAEPAATAAAAAAAAATEGAPSSRTPAASAATNAALTAAAATTPTAAPAAPSGDGAVAAASTIAVSTPGPAAAQQAGSTTPGAEVVPTPVGVKFVEDGSNLLRDQEMVRLLRQPRYFHDDFLEATVSASRCFNCGKPGHRASACTSEARLRPCYLCAQLGHEGKDCPAQLCFRCGRPGHKSRECTVQNDVSWETGRSRCLRCASPTCACANKADYFRYEGGCSEAYSAADLAKCKCYVCGQYGHLCCKLTPVTPALVTCYSCGSSAHHGEECPKENRTHLAAERAGDMRRAQREREAEIERAQELASRSRQPAFSGGYQSQQQQGGAGPRGYGNFQAAYAPQHPIQQYQQHQYPQHQQYQHGTSSAVYDRNPHKRPRYQDSYPQQAPMPVLHPPAPQQLHLLQPLPMQFQPTLGVYPPQPFVFGQVNPTYMPPPVVHGAPPMAMAMNVRPAPPVFAPPMFPPWPMYRG